MRPLRLCIAALAATMTLAACGSDSTETANSAEPQEVTVGISTASFGYLPLYVAMDQGLFEAEGLSLDFVEFAGGSEVMTGLLSGDVDVAGTSAEKPLFLHAEGRQVLNLVSFLNQSGSVLLVADEVEGEDGDLSVLKGETLGVTKPGSGTDIILRSMLQSQGLDPDSDTTLISVGSSDGILSGLETGQIKAAVVAEPIVSMAIERGVARAFIDPRAGDMPEFAAVPQTSALVLPTFIEKRPEDAKAFIRAVVKASCLIQKDPEIALDAVAEQFPNLDPELAKVILAAEAPLNDPRYAEENHEANLTFYREVGLKKEAAYADVVPGEEFTALWEEESC